MSAAEAGEGLIYLGIGYGIINAVMPKNKKRKHKSRKAHKRLEK